MLVAAAVVAAGCGGGSHATGPPASLALPGAPPVPTSEITSAAAQMCGIVAQSHQSPATVLQPFYAGPHNALHLLAALAAPKHRPEADQLLSVMLTYEAAIAAQPPPATTGADADALLQAVGGAMTALGLAAPAC
ncbi:MAG TPA: hypothetical protein VMU14_06175 [Acidimicrobiales bacterium]|nr:hypothetical protein [Acidimicrobiales bacterium]